MNEPTLSQLSSISTNSDVNLNNLISALQIIINQQYNIIKRHENEIKELHKSLSEIKHMLSGRQFLRSLSSESDLDNITY